MAEALVKVRFDLDSGDWHGHGSETLWATPVPGTEWKEFKTLNSPFFTIGISYLDIITAEATGDTLAGRLVFNFDKIKKRSGHSTLMLLVKPEEDTRFADYWNLLEKAGCSYESATLNLSIGKRLLFSVDVDPSADFDEIAELLERGHHNNILTFQTGYKSDAH
jgi:hypothetical protein